MKNEFEKKKGAYKSFGFSPIKVLCTPQQHANTNFENIFFVDYKAITIIYENKEQYIWVYMKLWRHIFYFPNSVTPITIVYFLMNIWKHKPNASSYREDFISNSVTRAIPTTFRSISGKNKKINC